MEEQGGVAVEHWEIKLRSQVGREHTKEPQRKEEGERGGKSRGKVMKVQGQRKAQRQGGNQK